MITALDDVLDTECAKHCSACGETLDPPGSQCAGCGALPAETRQEAAERLAGEADPVARAEAARLREEAAQYLVTAWQAFRRADRALYRSQLRMQRDQAQARLAEAVAGHEQALGIFGEALKAEEVLAGPLADAHQAHKRAVTTEETARRLRKSADDQIDADARLQAAVRLLARCQGESTAAATVRTAAESAAEVAAGQVRAREEERDRAQLLLDRHATVPLSTETARYLMLPATRMALGMDVDGTPIDPFERTVFAAFGMGLQAAALGELAGTPEKPEEDKLRSWARPLGDGFVEVRMDPPKAGGTVPPGATVTPPPDLRPDTGFHSIPGSLHQQAPRHMGGG